MRRFNGALQFLTVVPVGGRTSAPSDAALFFPLAGALLGGAAGAVSLIAGPLLAITFLAVVTGCLHEDGLADVADAFRAGRSREKILAILKDSRIGTYGAVALILSMGIRWQALAHTRFPPVYALCTALVLSRTAMVALAATTPPAGEGLGNAFVRGLPKVTAAGAIIQAAGIPFVAGWRAAVATIIATGITTWLARQYFMRRLGGITGDCLGATCQAVEAVNLVILAWPVSF